MPTCRMTVEIELPVELEVEGDWSPAEPDVGCGENFEVGRVAGVAEGSGDLSDEDLERIGIDWDSIRQLALEAVQAQVKGDD